MKICALTMVYRDYWALSRWYAHHGLELGPENLIVVAHGEDPNIARICPNARILTIPRDDLGGFDRMRWQYLNDLTAELLQDYDWVIRTDADELVCYDPERYGGLRAALGQLDPHETPVTWAMGFNVIETRGSTPMMPGPVLGQRRDVIFTGHYSKAVAVSQPVPLRMHGAAVGAQALASFPFQLPKGLYLAHLKYANTIALAEANKVRRSVAGAEGSGLPGAAWAEPDIHVLEVLGAFADKRLLPWDKAETKAHHKLTLNPKRDARYNILRARRLRLKFRTELPERFAAQG
ncbi:glycosyltransferase family 2 protein [Shimia sediminis]|uniref:glycosyltransferase family 2 protein n=1 Tax=Shimia sediminis TaxID=2497945 RepID=UPI000F8EC84E|nr:glycosyltransferase family 2 protein [Shimia sediminis]